MVGDSLTAGILPYQEDDFVDAGWESASVDGYPSRGVRTKASGDANTGLTAVDAIRAASGDSDVWVVALGTNDAGLYSAAQYAGLIREMLDHIGAGHLVMWVNIYLPESPARQAAWNAALEEVAAERPEQLVIYDWASVAAQHPGWLTSDGVHYTGSGYQNRSALIAAASAELLTTRSAAQRVSSPITELTATSDPAGFVATVPVRVLDTRRSDGVDGGEIVEVDLSALVGTDATAAALNVTAANASGEGYVTAFPCDTALPATSNLNVVPGRDVAVHAIAALDDDATVCLYVSAAADLIVDVFGWFEPDASLGLTQVDPSRLLDTRTDDATDGSIIEIEMPDDLGATAAVLNVTVTDIVSGGYVTVWPCGTAMPTASVLNYTAADDAIANAVEVGIGTDEAVCAYSSGDAELVVDLTGVYSTAGDLLLTTSVPTRVLDTRSGTGGWNGWVDAGQSLDVSIAAGAVVVGTVTATEGEAGYVLVWSGDGALPATSTLNVSDQHAVSASALVERAASGSITIASPTASGQDLLFDVVAWFA